MQNSQIRLSRARRRQRRRKAHIVSRTLLTLVALLILLPVFLTALYSFFSPGEIKAFMQTRGSFDAKSLMEIKLCGGMPLWLARALSECKAYPTSFSKYGEVYRVNLARTFLKKGDCPCA